jgi:hypothetical protein
VEEKQIIFDRSEIFDVLWGFTFIARRNVAFNILSKFIFVVFVCVCVWVGGLYEQREKEYVRKILLMLLYCYVQI